VDAEDCRPGCLITWFENDTINACFDEEAQHMGENGPCQPNVLLGINLNKPAAQLDRQVRKVLGTLLPCLSHWLGRRRSSK